MKKLIFTFLAFLIVIFSCNEKKVYVAVGEVKTNRYIGCYTRPDSTRVVDILMLQETTKYDSVKKKIVIDSVPGLPQYFPLKDSSGKDVIDPVTRQPKINPVPVYIKFNKDSVKWRIAGINYDSLMSKKGPTHD